MIACLRCGKPPEAGEDPSPVASISGEIMGDEYVESYRWCGRCGVYTVEVFHDRFAGEPSSVLRGPVSRAEGDRKVGLIRQCAEPWDKKCRCPAHRTYFGDALD